MQELYNEEFDCKFEVCVVHASHAGTCASSELSNPSDVDSKRTETLSEICRTGESTVASSTVYSGVTLEPSSEVSDSANNVQKQSFTVIRRRVPTDALQNLSAFWNGKENHK